MGRVTLKNLLARKFRLVLTSLAVIIGVGFMAAGFVLTDTLGNVFDDLFVDASKGIDAMVRAKEPFNAEGQNPVDTRPTVPDALVDRIEAVDGVQRAQGTVFQFALVKDKKGKAIQNQAPTFGTSWYPQDKNVVRNSLVLAPHWKGKASRQPAGPNQVALDERTAEDGSYRIGDTVKISFLGQADVPFTLTGVFEFGGKKDGLAGATLAAFTPSRAQEVMNRVGTWDSIDVRSDRDLSQVEVRDNIRKALPTIRRDLQAQGVDVPRLEAITGSQFAKEQASDIKDNLSFFNIFLLVFSIIVLFVGAFVIYNTFSITVAQRTRELGLMRALGASGRQVVTSVAVEALVLGLVSSVIGLGLGLLIVKPLEALLSAFGVDLPSGPLQVTANTILISVLVGTIVTFVSAISPARRAARVSPIAALQGHAVPPSSGRRRYVWGAGLTVVGVGLLVLGLFGGAEGTSAALSVGVAAAVVFIGVAMLSPLLAQPAARVLTWPAERMHSITGVLARQNAMRNPRRTASTAAALMVGLALVSVIAIFGSSAKGTFAAAIDDQTRADFFLSPDGFAPFPPEAAQLVRSRFQDEFGSPGTVVEWRPGTVEIDGSPNEVLGTTPNFRATSDVPLRGRLDTDAMRAGGLVVSQDVADDRTCFATDALDGARVRCHTGSFLRARFPAIESVQPVKIAGVYTDDKAVGSNTDYILGFDPHTEQWKQRFTDAFDTFVLIRKPAGVSTAAADKVVTHVAKEVGGIEAENKAEFKDRQLAQFDQILGLMTVLLALAVVVALLGIANTLALSIYERTHELGLLRAVGMSRVQMRRMIRGEALIVSVFGSLLGLAIGVVFGAAIVQALSSEGIKFTLPVGQLVMFVIAAGLAGLIAGTRPARRAAHLDVLRAVNAE